MRNELFKGDWSDEEDYAILDEEWSAAGRPAVSAVAWQTSPPGGPALGVPDVVPVHMDDNHT